MGDAKESELGKAARLRRDRALAGAPADVVSSWLRDELRPRLAAAGASEQELDLIHRDVELRIGSLYRHLPRSGSTLLLPAYEEAVFHQPRQAPDWVRAFTITSVRNSAIEELHTGDRLGDSVIVGLTTSASIALATVDPGRASKAFRTPMDGDPFGELQERFPTAWAALWHLGHGWSEASQEIRYPPVAAARAPIPELAIETIQPESPGLRSTVTLRSVILNGVDPRFDTSLRDTLHLLDHGELNALFTPSFKHLSRNIAKLYQVLEIVLTRGAPVVTPNYYMADGLVAARRLLCRPVHEPEGFLLYCRDPDGVAPVHAEALAHFADFAESAEQGD